MAACYVYVCLISLILFGVSNGQRCVEGQQSRKSNMYYVCRNGMDVPVACSTVDGIRVDPGSTYRSSTFMFTCQQLHSQLFVLTPTACIQNGQVINVGSTVTADNFWHTCSRVGDQVTLQIGGCVGDQGTRVGPGGIVAKGSFLFRCTFTGNTVSLQAYGCIVEGSHYPAGDIMKSDFWYQCSYLPGGRGLELKLAGCVENGQKMYDGSTSIRGGFLFKCEISHNVGGFRAVGCLDDRGGQHMLGETWQEGPPPVSYVMMCRKEGNRILKDLKQCYYQGADGSGPMDPQCVRRFGTTMVKCVQSGPGRLWGEVYSHATDETYRQALNAGFRGC